MKKIRWSKIALDNLEEIYDYIAENSAFYAERFTKALVARAEKINDFPESGRMVSGIDDPSVREVFYESYRIMYKIEEKLIIITQVKHMAQLLKFDDKI